ncbi:MAG: hypothetical protein ACREQ5_16145, partial [Candidatus Dormibacteria bacterium]
MSHVTGKDITGIMVFTSAEIKNMNRWVKLLSESCPEWHVLALNSETSSNRTATQDVSAAIDRYCGKGGVEDIAGRRKRGFIILTNSMGMRSFSECRIQVSLLMYDRGDMDVTAQKGPRCLTSGYRLNESKEGNHERRVYGHIASLSFDGQRSQQLDDIILQDIIAAKEELETDLPKAVRYVAQSINHFMVGADGKPVLTSKDQLTEEYSDPQVLKEVGRALTDPAVFDDDELIKAALKYSDSITDSGSNLKNVTAQVKGLLDKLPPTFTDRQKHKARIKREKSARRMLEMFIKRLVSIGCDVCNYIDKPMTLAKAMEKLMTDEVAKRELSAKYDGLPFEIIKLFVDRKAVVPEVQDMVIEAVFRTIVYQKNQVSLKGTGKMYANAVNMRVADNGGDPRAVWDDITDALPKLTKDAKVLVLAGGTGTELESLGRHVELANLEVWFNDINQGWCNRAKRRFGLDDKHIYCGDARGAGFAKWVGDMKFDLVISNPPYQSIARV